MKVLFILSDCNAEHGSFLSVLSLGKELQKMGIVTKYIIPKWDDGAKLLAEEGLCYSLVRSYSWVVSSKKKNKAVNVLKWKIKKLLNYIAVVRISIIAKQFGAQIMHINSIDSYVGALAGRIMNIPVIWHFREFLEEDHESEFWERDFSYRIIGYASRIVCVSDSLREKYSIGNLRNKTITIYNGIDVKKFYNPERDIFRSEPIKIAIIGRICEHKGQLDFVDAISIINKRLDGKVSAYCVGDGKADDVERVCKRITDKKIHNIEMVGFQSDITSWYHNIDIIVVCSHSEAFGRVTVEAMLSGCLVIGADSAGTKELIVNNETGWLYRTHDSRELAEKVMFAISNIEESRVIARNGQRYMQKNMTAEKNATRIAKLYNECTSNNK